MQLGARRRPARRGPAAATTATPRQERCASDHGILCACAGRSTPASQSSAASTVSTAGPASRGGRRTMMTGRLSSRAAISLASVAAPPLALHTSTSIAWRCSRCRSSASAERAAPEHDLVEAQRQAARAAGRSGARQSAPRRPARRRAIAPAPTVSQARRPTRPTICAAASMLSTSIQRSSGWRRQGGRSSISRGTRTASQASRADGEISRGERVGRVDQPVDPLLEQIVGEPRRAAEPADPHLARDRPGTRGCGRPARWSPSIASPKRASTARASAAASPVPPRIRRWRGGHQPPPSPTRARNPPARSTIATSTAVCAAQRRQRHLARPPRDRVGQRSRQCCRRVRAPRRRCRAMRAAATVAGSAPSARRAARASTARIDPAAARMQVEMAGGELGHLGEAAGQGQPRAPDGGADI